MLFPGVEITTGDNIHLLAIFNYQYNTKMIESVLDEIGCPSSSRGEASCITDTGTGQIIAVIEKNKGIAIPAHIDRKRGKGMFCLHPDLLSSLIATGKIHVVESSGSISEWPYPYRNNPYKWAVIAGSDTHTLNDDDPISRTPGSITTKILSDNLHIEGLKRIFLSGNISIIREVISE